MPAISEIEQFSLHLFVPDILWGMPGHLWCKYNPRMLDATCLSIAQTCDATGQVLVAGEVQTDHGHWKFDVNTAL